MMSPSAASGSNVTVTANWYAFTTQIDSAGVAFSSRAIAGRAILAMATLNTEIAMAITTVSSAARRSRGGRPSESARIGSIMRQLDRGFLRQQAAPQHEQTCHRVSRRRPARVDRLQRTHEPCLLRGGLRSGDGCTLQ